jgi:hypothetical protein
VKYALTATARDAASDDPLAVGAGVVDAYRAAFSAPPGEANQGLDRSTGMGSLGQSRGSVQTQADDPPATVLGSVLGATLTAQLVLWNPGAYVNANWRPADWYLSAWAVFRFYRLGWYESNWPGNRWHGSSWYGQYDDSDTYGSTLSGSAWYGVWE